MTGKRVQFFPVQSNAAQIEAMRAGRLHVAGFNTGSNPIAVNCAGFVPFAMMASKDNAYGYEMEIITHPGSGVKKVEDIKGKKMAFTAETSNAGYKAPSALLRDKFNMAPGKDYEPVFSGKHDNSILGVANKGYPAAAIAKFRQGADDRPRRREAGADGGRLQIRNLPDDRLRLRLQPEAGFTFDWAGSELLKEFEKSEPPQEKFMPINFKEHWQVVRDIDKAMDVKYECK